jgi:hypothetical protein
MRSDMPYQASAASRSPAATPMSPMTSATSPLTMPPGMTRSDISQARGAIWPAMSSRPVFK